MSVVADIHTHVLYRFDDGPKTPEDSVALLQAIAASGVTDVISTSHYYSDRMPPEEFVERRARRLASVRELIAENGIPLRIYAGAEVNLSQLILNLPSLAELCFEGTNRILLEIPHSSRDLDAAVELIDRVISYYNVVPVVAHVERYDFFFKKMKNLERLKQMGCFVQIDAECVLDGFFSRRFALKAIEEGYVDIVASDCHDTGKRAPNLIRAYEEIEKKLGAQTVAALKENAASLLVK